MNHVPAQQDWFAELLQVMAMLRSDKGCPWDRKQTHESLKKHLIEEAYELIEAIDAGDHEAVREELGDLLLQVVFHSQIARERGQFDIQDVARTITEKMLRRHPHVFANTPVHDESMLNRQWEAIKKTEPHRQHRPSALDGVPRNLPALRMADKIQQKASGVGFDWPDVAGVLAKIQEELLETREAITHRDQQAIREELGDVLFVLVRLCRSQGESAEDLLRSTVDKFYRRFRHVEQAMHKAGKTMEESTLDEMEAFWRAAKQVSAAP